jgi:8-oxo-dGTP pyrophosphatase MutT (NUDIX family)
MFEKYKPTEEQLAHYSGAGLILITFDMKFLLVREIKSGKWGICKGHRERKDEYDPVKTAKREAYEELGLEETDYEIYGSNFILPGSPKTYIFQCARLKVDIVRHFQEKKVNIAHVLESRKLHEITEIKLVSYYNLIQDLNNYNNNVYLRLLQAHLSGTFVQSPILVNRKQPLPFDSPSSDLERLSIHSGDVTMASPPKKFYNSSVIGGSPIQIVGGKLPDLSPIIAPITGELDLPPLHLKSTEDAYPTGRSSPMKVRERTESGGSLLDALRSSPTLDRGPSPFTSYPSSSPTMNMYYSGGGAGGSISPRTCATSYLLPHSPSPTITGH